MGIHVADEAAFQCKGLIAAVAGKVASSRVGAHAAHEAIFLREGSTAAFARKPMLLTVGGCACDF